MTFSWKKSIMFFEIKAVSRKKLWFDKNGSQLMKKTQKLYENHFNLEKQKKSNAA